MIVTAKRGHLLSSLFTFSYRSPVRADRLVAIVLLLQAHGQRTAAQLAEALEASPRTIRRDLLALSAAGVPVYAQPGRGGGWALLGGHRLDLTGLTANEARALVLALAGAPGHEGVEAAVRKVVAALPAPLRDQAAATRASTHVDPSGWRRTRSLHDQGDGSGGPEELRRLRQAIEVSVQVNLCYAKVGAEASWRRVHPLGLVAKRGTWYLVGRSHKGLRTYRVSRVEAVELTDDPVSWPEGFDLPTTWEALERDFKARMPTADLAVELLVDPVAWPRLGFELGGWWDVVDQGPAPDGRRRVEVKLPGVPYAAAKLATFADAVEVLSPPKVRAELAALGRRLTARYSDPAG